MSGAMISFEVIPEDGEPFRVDCTARDILVWEKRHRDNSFGQFRENTTMIGSYQITHIAARRLGLFDGDLATFEATCDLMPGQDAEEEMGDAEVPTKPAP